MENLITFVKVGEERLNADYIPFPCKKGGFIFFVEEVDKEDGPRAWGWQRSKATSEDEAIKEAKELSSETEGWYKEYTPYRVVFVK